MKYTVKISNLSFDMELIPKVEDVPIVVNPEPEIPVVVVPDIPVVEEPVVIPVPPIQVGYTYLNITDQFYSGVKDKNLNEMKVSGADIYRIDYLQKSGPSRTLKIWSEKQCSVLAGIENYDPSKQFQDDHLFALTGGTELFTDNINWCNPKQIRSTQPQLPSLFRSVQDPKAKWTAVIRNCDTTALGRNGGFGIGFAYGGIHENHLGLINFKHVGPGLMDCKNPYPDSVLYLTMQNVDADFSNKTEFGSNYLKVNGYVKDNVFTITSDHTLDFLFNNFFVSDKNDNRATILHIGRFTFMLDDIEAVINPKQIRLRPMANGYCKYKSIGDKFYFIGKEIHVGDIVAGFRVEEKDRDNHPLWSNNHKPLESEISYTPYVKLNGPIELIDDSPLYVLSSWDQEGIEQDAYLIYKANDSFRTTPKTIFGDPNNWNKILSGEAVGHQLYNHGGEKGISLWADNVKITGFYRQTEKGLGKSLGYNMVNCEGFWDSDGKTKDEFKHYNLTMNKPMPERVAKIIA